MHAKRSLTVALAATAILVSSCGGGDDDNTGTVYFKIDAATCPSAAVSVALFINGTRVGTETLSAGSTSSGYSTAAGSAVLSASLVGITYSWSPSTHNIPKGGSFTLVLTC